MTTLPQTTPMRLPRPSGAGQIAIPSAPQGGMLGPVGGGPGAGAGAFQMTGSDVWRVFRTNWWLIAGMVILMAVAGFFANGYLVKHHPRYRANGLVKVQLAEEVFRQGADQYSAQPQAIEVELKTQARGLLQPGLLLSVLTDSEKMRQTEYFKEFNNDPEAAKEHLLDNFNVQPIATSRLISVEMTYRVPKDARTIVEEVVSRYIAEQRARVAEQWGGKAQQLDEQFRMHEREYRKITDQLTAKSTTLGSKESFQLFGMLEIRRHEMFRLTETKQKAESELAEASNAYNTMVAMINSGDTPPEIESELFKDQLSSDYQRQLDQIESRISQAGGPNGPQAAGMLKSKATVQQKLEDRREQLRSAQLNFRRFELETKMNAAAEALKVANERTKLATEELQTMQAAAASYKLLEEQQKTVKDKMDEVRDELEKIQNQKLPSNWTPIDWFTRPPTPETPAFPQLPVTMGVAVLLGLALSIGIAFLREVTDQTVRSPRDIARVGNMNLLGMIPHESDDPQAAGARLPLVIFDAPNSMAAEEFRKLRTRLQHTASLDSTRSILVSSANPGDGKTSVACNLAAGLALNGRRILLVDANFRRPDIHNVFEVANERGLGDALNDLSTFDTLVRDTPVQNLYVMPTGPKPVNATELLESQLLIDFIERALEDYDHVIFDSGPLLVVSETMALAPRVDGVVTVVRARTNSRGVLQRMRDMLRQVKAEHLGVVLNAVRSQGGGYYGRNIKTYYAYQNS